MVPTVISYHNQKMEDINLKAKRCCKIPMKIVGNMKLDTSPIQVRRHIDMDDTPVIIYQCTKCGKGKIVEVLE